jgi:integrase
LARASVYLHWKGVRSLFHQVHDELAIPRPYLKMPWPSFKRAHVKAFSEEEVRHLVKACEYTVDKFHAGLSHVFHQRRPTAGRDKAMVLTLLDAGLRVGECLRLQIQDVDLATGEIIVAPYGTGKKTRPRMVMLGITSRRAVWLYVAKLQGSDPFDRLLPLTPLAARPPLSRLGERVRVPNMHQHRLRHSFATRYLRGGEAVFTLQRLLGHSDLAMTN